MRTLTDATSTPEARRPAFFPPSPFPPRSPLPPFPPLELRGVMSVALEAVPDRTARSPLARRLRVPAHEVAAASLLDAIEVVRAFILEHRVGALNFGRLAGVVRRGGTPVARITHGLRIMELDAARTLTGRELGEDGEVVGVVQEHAGGGR